MTFDEVTVENDRFPWPSLHLHVFQFRDILTASGSSLVVGGGNTVLDSSEGKCVYALARNNCDANPDIDPNHTGHVAAQHSQTQVASSPHA